MSAFPGLRQWRGEGHLSPELQTNLVTMWDPFFFFFFFNGLLTKARWSCLDWLRVQRHKPLWQLLSRNDRAMPLWVAVIFRNYLP
jgi:hypothetical protein